MHVHEHLCKFQMNFITRKHLQVAIRSFCGHLKNVSYVVKARAGQKSCYSCRPYVCKSVKDNGYEDDANEENVDIPISVIDDKVYLWRDDLPASDGKSWNWIPPREVNEIPDDIIPIIDRKLLTTEEISSALVKLGGQDVVVLDVRNRKTIVDYLVIVTGNTTKHLQKMSYAIVKALKDRNLREAPGYTGVEGHKEDDWMAVDCSDVLVNFFLPYARKAINLESLWSEGGEKNWPNVSSCRTQKEYEDLLDRYVEANPVPEEYFLKNYKPVGKSKGSSTSVSSSFSSAGSNHTTTKFARTSKIPKDVRSL